jgi:hypothetical protein
VKKSVSELDRLRVHADALLEREDPQGEAIQLACELETIALGDPKRRKLAQRFDELVFAYDAAWKAPIRAVLPERRYGSDVDVGLFRGMPTHLNGSLENILAALDKIGELAAINSLDPSFMETKHVEQLVAHPVFEKLVRLHWIGSTAIGDPLYEVLFKAPRFPALEQLAIGALSAANTRVMAACESLRSLKRLKLDGVDVGIDDLAPLLSRAGEGLEALELNRVTVGAAGIATIAKHCTKLRVLALEHCAIDAKAAEALATHAAFASLEELRVGGNNLKEAGIGALAGSKHLASLARVSFARTAGDPPFGAKAMAAFVEAYVWKKLVAIDLESCNLRADGAMHLAALDKIQELDLRYNALGDEGVGALARVKFRALRSLTLDSNTITATGMAKLAKAPWLAALEELSLRHNKFNSPGGQALGKGKLDKLRVLALGHNWMGSTGLRAILLNAPSLAVISEGVNNYSTPELVKSLLDAKRPPPLRSLNVYALPKKVLEKFVVSERVATLRALELHSDDLDDTLACALVENEHFDNLTRLTIAGRSLGEVGRIALKARFQDRLTLRT